MRTLLILVLIIAVGLLTADDLNNRKALDQAAGLQDQVNQLTTERDQLRAQLSQRTASPDWFQQQLNAKPDLQYSRPGSASGPEH
jgi:hypothetical protein